MQNQNPTAWVFGAGTGLISTMVLIDQLGILGIYISLGLCIVYGLLTWFAYAKNKVNLGVFAMSALATTGFVLLIKLLTDLKVI